MTATEAPAKPTRLPRDEDPRNPVHRLRALLDEGTLELITPDDDSGMLAALHTLAALGTQDGSLSQLLRPYARYLASGEINSTVNDAAAKVAEITAKYADAGQDELDGLTVDLGDGVWFNVRASNTEPLLRLNVEAPDAPTLERVRDEVLGLIRS